MPRSPEVKLHQLNKAPDIHALFGVATSALESPTSSRSKKRKRGLIFFFLALLFASFFFYSASALAQDQPRRLVALLDYLASDYKNAVQSGKVINQDEYAEMQEFSKRTVELFDQIKAADQADKAGVESNLKSLANRIAAKADPKTISDLAQSSKQKLMTAYQIIPYPRQLPALESGKTLYLDNCAQCHGESGNGDGPGRETMNPKTPAPANFTDPERMAGLSPFKVFNTASFGVEGTAMASFAALSDEQRWQVAFYVLSLRFSQKQAAAGKTLFQTKSLPVELTSIATLSTLSDEQLSAKLNSQLKAESQAHDALAYLRRGVLEKKASEPLFIARTRLREAAELYARGEKAKAYQKAVEAYLDGFELAEPALFAKDASFGRSLEGRFTQFRAAIKQGVPTEEIQKRQVEMAAELGQASAILTRDDSFSAYYSFANSALIILREGLEAALILAAILAMLRVMGANQAIRYIHLGWILALVAGLLTWLASETVLTLSGQHRESMEGFITVFAAVVLFYVGYWLHTRAEAKKWQMFIQEKVKEMLSAKKIFALIGTSFFAVYREAFEVVLFYQALWLQSDSSHGAIIWGFVAGMAALIVATLAILKLGLRIPLKYFFGATGTLLYIMAFIFAGNGIKELQAAGWAPTTPLHFTIQVPLLGIYPTFETLAAQALLLMAFLWTTMLMGRGQQKPA
jgi:high-affinity iron transporter